MRQEKKVKICTKCHKEKSSIEFHNDKTRLDGKFPHCKECVKEERRTYYNTEKGMAKIKRRNFEYKRTKRGKRADKRYSQSEKGLITRKKALLKYKKTEKYKIVQDRYWKSEKGRAVPKRYFQNNKLSCAIRCAVNRSFKNAEKELGVFRHLDYTIDELKSHLEGQFKEGMSWENRKEWHIDHIWPISSFNFNSVEDEDFKLCWGLNNLQPLWAKENLIKGVMIPYEGS